MFLASAERAGDAPLLDFMGRKYSYAETADGVRVYCEDNCNPDEVLNRMKQVIKTLQ